MFVEVRRFAISGKISTACVSFAEGGWLFSQFEAVLQNPFGPLPDHVCVTAALAEKQDHSKIAQKAASLHFQGFEFVFILGFSVLSL